MPSVNSSHPPAVQIEHARTDDPDFFPVNISAVAPGVRTEPGNGGNFRHFLDFIWAETCRGGQFTRSELAVREIEHTCATLLILASEAEIHRQIGEQSPSLGKTPVEIAEEYLRANIAEPFQLDKLIEITGTSASTLLRDFRKRYGMPPLQYLKNCRLEAAHRELATTELEETTVTEVAMRYGFYHLGRFAAYYQTAFGELPSETLGRAH